MSTGLGIVLLIGGIVLVSGALEFDVAGIQDGTFGWILILGGLLAIALGLMTTYRARSTRVVEEERPARRRTVERTDEY